MDIVSLTSQFGGFVWAMLFFVIALSVIVAIHEYGHYIVGRWSGIHAEVFSLGFGPVLASRVDRRGTRWQIAALPFGGYVRFMGDADAASAGQDGDVIDALSPEDRRRTMAGAPLWARAATVAAGPIFNFVLAALVFMGVGYAQGIVDTPLSVGKMSPLPYENVDLRPGDKILQIEGQDVPEYYSADFTRFSRAMPLRETLRYTVERDGQQIDINGPYLLPPLIKQLAPQSAAYKINLKAGDVILSAAGTPIFAFSQLKEIVLAAEGAPINLMVWRDGQELAFTLSPRRVDEPQPGGGFETHWRIGIVGGVFFEPATSPPGIQETLVGGVKQLWEIMRGSVSGLYHMITGAISSCNMSGPIGIAKVSAQAASQGAMGFVYFIGVLSAAVGLLNLFPIPILDGGHLVFYAYEAVVGRPPSEGALRILMATGLAIILSLMVFALFMDLFC